jgi:hypothetical protein
MKVQDGPITLPANAAIAAYLRVKLTAGFLAVAGDEDEVGTNVRHILAGDPAGTVLPRGYSCVRLHVANGAIAANVEVFAAAAGKIAAAGTRSRGLTLEAASGDGAVIRVLTQ